MAKGVGMGNKLGVAVVGMGAIGREHATIYRGVADSELVRVCDPAIRKMPIDPTWGDVEVCESLDEVLNDDAVEAVSLCTPDQLHFEDALRIMASGRHLLLEKPIAVTPDEVMKLVDAADAASGVVMPGQTLRFEPRYHHAREQVASGALGQLVHGYLRRNNKASVAARANGRVQVSFFLGVHDIDALLWITGDRVVQVQALASEVKDASGLQSAAVLANLLLESGAAIQLEAAWALPEAHPTELDSRFRLVGTGGEISIDTPSNAMHVASTRFQLPMPEWGARYGAQYGPLFEEIAHFVRCCREGIEPAVAMREAGNAVLVIDAIERAVLTGEVHKVSHL
jgi:predicted dehydrogenase